MSARVIQLIEVDEQRGAGIPGDPIRRVAVYYTLDGEYVAETHDPWGRQCEQPEHDHRATRGTL